nr:dimethylargininase [Mycolicibacterium komanii]CRL75103.1 N-dimethylarginine dimethylaminohydrolase [Mycolicibacterium komanii]
MTVIGVAPARQPNRPSRRQARVRRYVMTPPTYFGVEYVINPWMDTATPVDTELALAQWETLCRTYKELGHVVDAVDPVPGLPDMVYAANGGLIVSGVAVVARFAYPQRAAEAAAYAEWMAQHGYQPVQARHTNEGQGDLLIAGSILLAGYGFRTDRRAHDEIAQLLGLATYSFELVDPRFYHLDTALAVLDDTTIAYYPPAFSDTSRVSLRTLFPDAIEVASADAYVLGLNVVSDGYNVVLPAAATGFAAQLREAGFNPVGVDLSELLKGGGSIKCCTLEVHR